MAISAPDKPAQLNLSDWVEPFQQWLDKLTQQTHKVNEMIRQEQGFVFCAEKPLQQLIDEAELNWAGIDDPADARDAISRHLQQWSYDDQKRVMVACAEVSSETIEQARVLNVMKERWKDFHYDFRTLAGRRTDGDKRVTGFVLPGSGETPLHSDIKATEMLGEALRCVKNIDYRISLDATDRKIPIVPGPAISINWYLRSTRPSTRQPLEVVIDLLERYRLTVHGELRAIADQELAYLRRQPAGTEVAHRAKGWVNSVRYGASFLLDGQHQKATPGYAVNPILFPKGGYPPTLTLFEPKRSGAGVGRPATISDDPVSSLIPHFYWYKRRSTAARASTAARNKPKRSHNPYAATAFPGLWLGTRKRKHARVPLVMVRTPDNRCSSYSIARGGLSKAWATAATKYCEQRPVSYEDVIKGIPSEYQVRQMVEWAEKNSG